MKNYVLILSGGKATFYSRNNEEKWQITKIKGEDSTTRIGSALFDELNQIENVSSALGNIRLNIIFDRMALGSLEMLIKQAEKLNCREWQIYPYEQIEEKAKNSSLQENFSSQENDLKEWFIQVFLPNFDAYLGLESDPYIRGQESVKTEYEERFTTLIAEKEDIESKYHSLLSEKNEYAEKYQVLVAEKEEHDSQFEELVNLRLEAVKADLLQPMQTELLVLQQRCNELEYSLRQAEAAREKCQTEQQKTEQEKVALQLQLEQLSSPSIEHLATYLPIIYRNFWNEIKPSDLALLAKTYNVPQVPSPFLDPDDDIVQIKKREFLALPEKERRNVLAMCKNLPSYLKVRPTMKSIFKEE